MVYYCILFSLFSLASSAGIPIITNFSPVSSTCISFNLTVQPSGGSYSGVVYVLLYQGAGVLVSNNSVTLSGTTSKTASFIYPKAGSYYASLASSGGSVLYTSSSVNIVSVLGSITLSSNVTSPTVYQQLSITAILKESCGNLVSSPISLALSPSNILGTKSLTTSNGSAVFNVYSTATGTISISVASGSITGLISLNFLTAKLFISSFSPPVISIQPTTSVTKFNLTVGVYNNDRTILLNLYPQGTVNLATIPAGVLTGTANAITVNGLALFTNLLIAKTGVAQINATMAGPGWYNTSLQIMPPEVKTFIMVINNSCPTAYFNFTVTVSLFDQDGNSFVNSSTIVITPSSLSGSLSAVTTTGSAMFTVYSSTIGNLNITANVSSKAVSVVIPILQPQIKIVSINPTPYFKTSIFTLTALIYDNFVVNLLTFKAYPISLYLSPLGTLSGTTTVTSTNGKSVFLGLMITTTGTYTISANSSGLLSDTSSSISITAPALTTVSITSSNVSISAYFNFTLTVFLLDQSGSLWLSSSSITISSNLLFGGSMSLVTITGSGVFSVYGIQPGTAVFTGQSSLKSSNVSVSILADILKFTLISPLPTSPNTAFQVQVTVFDNSLSTVVASNGPITVTLSLNVSSILVGNTVANTSNGIATFSNMKIIDIGAYQLIASAKYMANIYSNSVYQTYSSYLNLSIVTSNVSSPSVYFYFLVTVSVVDQKGNSWLNSTNITIAGSNIYSASSLSNVTNTGAAYFLIYCSSTGNLVITSMSISFTGSVTGFLNLNILNNSLKIDSITPIVIYNQPTLTTSIFSLVVSVYDPSLTYKETTMGIYQVTISINTGTLIGSLSLSTTSGTAVFSNLQITTPGSIILRASSPSLNPATASLSISALTINISTSVASPTCFFDFIITIKIYDQSSLYTQLASISLSSSNIQISSQIISTSTGSGGSSAYYTLSGLYNITASAFIYTGSLEVTVSQALLFISSIYPTPSSVTSPITVIINIQDTAGNIENKYGPHTINLLLVSSQTQLAAAQTNGGVAIFNNIYITVNGSQQLTATSSDMQPVFSDIFIIQSAYLSSLQVGIAPSSPSANQPFDIQIILLDSFDFIWTFTTALNVSGNITLSGPNSLTTNTGQGLATYYVSQPGTLLLTISSGGIVVNKTIEILSQTLLFLDLPSTVKVWQSFSFRVGVFDNSMTVLESLYGPYSISLNLIPSVDITGSLSQVTTAGVSYFSNLFFNAIGNYSFIASSNVTGSYTSSIIRVVINYDIGIDISCPDYLVCKNLYTFEITVTNQTDSSKLQNYPVYMHVNGRAWGELMTDGNGVADFSLIFNQSGSYLLEYYCDIGYVSLSVNISVCNNDPLCITAVSNSSLCLTCVNGAVLIDGVCQCLPGMSFNSNAGECSCPAEEKYVNNKCVKCGNYLSVSDIESYYSEDYLSIVVSFSKEVNIANLKQCSDILIGPEYFSSLDMTCTWKNSTSLLLVLTNYPYLSYNVLQINNDKVQAVGGNCNYNMTDLNINISQRYSIPIPETYITTPPVYSLSCSSNNLTAFATIISKYIIYKWSSHGDPDNEIVDLLISRTQGYYIDIPRTYLTPSILTIRLDTSYANLNTYFSANLTVSIINEKKLIVVLNSPSNKNLTVSSSYLLIASVSENCNSSSSSYSFAWTCSDSSLDLSRFLNPSRPDTLQFPPYSLTVFKTYLFTATVSDGTISGYASTNISVVQSDLIVILSRSSGSVPASMPLVINATVTDPDDSNSEINKTWTCREQNKTCLDSSNSSLTLLQVKGNLTVDSLRPRALYEFLFLATSHNKSASLAVLIYVDPNITGTIEIRNQVIKINPDYVYNQFPKFLLNGQPSFSWKIDDSPIDNLTSPYYSYIGFRENILQEGQSFNLSIEVANSAGGGVIKSYIKVITNLGPQCRGTTYDFIDGSWVLTQILCVDGDDKDYPLSYQIGYLTSAGDLFWLSEMIQSFKFKVKVPDEADKFCVRVCDALSTCKLFNSTIKKKERSRVLQSMNMSSILIDSKNFLDIPNVIIIYSKGSVDATSYLYLFYLLEKYFTNINIDIYSVDLMISCVDALFSANNTGVSIYNNATKLLISTLQKLSQRLNDEAIVRTVNVFSKYIGYIDSMLLVELFKELSNVWTRDITPNAELLYNGGNISFYWVKMNGAFYPAAVLYNSKMEIEVNPNNDYSYDKMYDLVVILLNINRTLILSASFKDTADYIDYYLSLKDPVPSNITPSFPIIISIKNPLNGSLFDCSSVNNSQCSIDKVNKTHIVVGIHKFDTYTIFESIGNCGLFKLPIIILSMTAILFTAITVVFYKSDSKQEYSDSLNKKYIRLNTFTGLFVKQHSPRRLVILSEIGAIISISMGLTGLTYVLFDLSVYLQSLDINIYSFNEVGRCVIAFGVIQFVSISSLCFRCFSNGKKSIENICLIINVSMAAIGFISTVVTCLLVCPKNTEIWLINFSLMVNTQVFVINQLYTLVFFIILQRNSGSHFSRVSNVSHDFYGNKSSNFNTECVDGTTSRQKKFFDDN